jgi:hypothetical protein
MKIILLLGASALITLTVGAFKLYMSGLPNVCH